MNFGSKVEHFKSLNHPEEKDESRKRLFTAAAGISCSLEDVDEDITEEDEYS